VSDVEALDWPEAALLAALIRSPVDYDPFVNAGRATERRRIALQRLVETGKLTQGQADLYAFTPLPSAPHLTSATNRDYFSEEVVQQLLNETDGDNLDCLIIDLPPGAGDIQLTLCQRIPVSGAIIVTTPQDIALLDARKALKMFEKVEVPVLGIVENMAVHTCSSCGHVEHLFGEGGGQRMAAQYGVPLLGSLPLDIAIREQGDAGRPVVVAAPDSAAAQAYRQAARALVAQLESRPRAKPSILSSLV
jgi:MinD-like ATPase involved in chromosome partitioning or flagellar assembly